MTEEITPNDFLGALTGDESAMGKISEAMQSRFSELANKILEHRGSSRKPVYDDESGYWVNSVTRERLFPRWWAER